MSTRVPSRDDIYDALRTGKALICAPGEKPDVGAWLDFTTALLKVLRDPDITPHPDGLMIQGAYFADGLKLNNYAINHDLRFKDCTFPLPVEAKYAQLHSLYFSGCTVSSISLELSCVDGSFIIEKTNINSAIEPALNLTGVKITKGLRASNLHISGEFLAYRAEIDSFFIVKHSTLSNPLRRALLLDHATITGGLFAQNLETEGEVRAPGATINGQFNLTGATLTNPEGDALLLDHATITGGLFAQNLETEGEVRAPGATIIGQLVLTGATLTNPHGNPLGLDGATIEGDLFAQNLETEGEVRAPGATINGQLNLTGTTLTNPHGDALLLDHATITGGLFAQNLETEGEVRAPGATINGQLVLTGTTLTNPHGNPLGLDGATITDLFLNYKTVDGTISLVNTRISHLQTPNVIEPRHGKILATGWKVDSIEGALHTNPETAKKWLDTTPDNEFSPQPFMELARYFDRVGLPHHARHLRVYSHSKVTNNMPLKSRPGRWMLHVTSGYGERPWCALAWLVFLFILTWLLTRWQADHLETADQVRAVCRDGWRITEYAGKNAIPSFPGATTKCSLADDTPIWLRLSFAFTAGLSWIMLTIFLAGVAGILRKPADSSTS
ncbi:polymer-forming cytoskeletal protein [Corynebacterium pygosceleis]|uniref:polymer-forming cytoskeletal protein n=1 Tax=Corynebacterium pygosceleis TaxID=2800406 RepID=UPI0020103C94|nr:polymer-forming cytoskeletal protein [Corynebacterium pygosceleis]MCL0120493.1 polymer-forming cytoskeletal protein [Corynebacterium pygosceleis]